MRALLIAFSLLIATQASAAEWKEDTKSRNYVLVDGKSAMTVECYAQKPKEDPSISVHFWPACGASCKAPKITDEKALATVILDGQIYSVAMQPGNTEDVQLVPSAAKRDEFLKALTTTSSITVFSSQLKPKQAEFDDIKAGETLNDYYTICKQAAGLEPLAPSVLTEPLD